MSKDLILTWAVAVLACAEVALALVCAEAAAAQPPTRLQAGPGAAAALGETVRAAARPPALRTAKEITP